MKTSLKEKCVHPFKRLHWVNDIVFCNKCKTTLHISNKRPVLYTEEQVIEILKKVNFKFGTATSNELHEWFDQNKKK